MRVGTTVLGALLVLAGVLEPLAASAQTVVDDAALTDESDGRNWLGFGRTYSEKRFSP